MDKEKSLTAAVPEITRVGHELATKPPPPWLVNNVVFISAISKVVQLFIDTHPFSYAFSLWFITGC